MCLFLLFVVVVVVVVVVCVFVCVCELCSCVVDCFKRVFELVCRVLVRVVFDWLFIDVLFSLLMFALFDVCVLIVLFARFCCFRLFFCNCV